MPLKKLTAIILICLAVLIVCREASPGRFVGSSRSNKYHLESCQWAKRINPDNLVIFNSKEEARAKGYIPCRVCKP